ARPDEGLRTDGERMMDLWILDKGVIDRRGTLAEQDMVFTGGETRHPGGAEPAHRGEAAQGPRKGPPPPPAVDGDGPVRDAFDMQQTHRILLLFTVARLPARAPPLAWSAHGVPPGPRLATPGAR